MIRTMTPQAPRRGVLLLFVLCACAGRAFATPPSGQAWTAVGAPVSTPTGVVSAGLPPVDPQQPVELAPDGGGAPQAITVLAIQAVAPRDSTLFAPRTAVATLGIPLGNELQVGLVDGRPALGIVGADSWQFRALDTWPDGSVRWALVDVAAPVGRGLPASGVTLVPGAGLSTGGDIVRTQADVFQIDTGPLQAIVRASGFNLLDSVVVDGMQVVKPGASPGIVATSPDGDVLSVGETELSLEDNGPARALIRVDGVLVDGQGATVTDFTCRIEATRGSRDLEVVFTLRNANVDRPAHLRLGSVDLVLRCSPGAQPRARFATPVGDTEFALAPLSVAYAYQAFSGSVTLGVLGPGPAYKPHIPKLDASTLADEGYRVVLDGTPVFEGDVDSWPLHGYARLSGTRGGVTASIRHMPFFWPAALEVTGEGYVVAGVFSHRNESTYTFVWRQHESRTVTFSFHSGEPEELPIEVARRGDALITGRVRDDGYYDATGVFAHDLVTVEEQELAYALMGIDHQVELDNDELKITRHLPAGLTGAGNNHPSIQRRLADEFLRFGHGGQLIGALDLALYKAEWQILRSDNFRHANDPGPVDDSVPHTGAAMADLEHRYREGLVLAYHLTGDERFRAALEDEAEILLELDFTPQERSMYQTLRALAVLSDFVEDDVVRQQLLDDLRQRLATFSAPLIDVHGATSGWGWQGVPGDGERGYFVNSSQNNSEKPPGENFQTRGWITASLGPHAFFRVARVLPASDPLHAVARLRSLDLARWTGDELFPFDPDPAERRLALSYAVTLQQVVQSQLTDFHSILLGQAEAWRTTGNPRFLIKGAEQVQALDARGNLDELDTRLEHQHFFRAILDFAAEAGL